MSGALRRAGLAIYGCFHWAWAAVATVGSYVWHNNGELGRVRVKGNTWAAIAVFAPGAAPRRITARTRARSTMARSGLITLDCG